jgi:hypothetical protein
MTKEDKEEKLFPKVQKAKIKKVEDVEILDMSMIPLEYLTVDIQNLRYDVVVKKKHVPGVVKVIREIRAK